MYCRRCKTWNPLPRILCVRCGAALPPDAVRRRLEARAHKSSTARGLLIILGMMASLTLALLVAGVAARNTEPADTTAAENLALPAAPDMPAAFDASEPETPTPFDIPVPSSIELAPATVTSMPPAATRPAPSANQPAAIVSTPALTRTPMPLPTPTRALPPVGLAKGQTAPNFTLKNLAGQPVTLQELRGHPVIVDFWASWCTVCRQEMPDLNAVAQAGKLNGLIVLAVNMNETSRSDAIQLLRTKGPGLTLLWDTGSVNLQYKIKALPTSYFMNREGVIAAVRVGRTSRAGLNESAALIR